MDRRPNLDFKTVIYGTDFSHWSRNAGLYAALLAKYFPAQLLVAHAFTLSQAAMEVELDRALKSQQRRDLQSLLAKEAAAFAAGPMKAVPVLLDGDPKEALPALADTHGPSMLVLGTHGGGRLEREFIGSVAEEILRSTRWPCLTIAPHVRPASAATFPFRRILYATDFTPAAAQAAVYAISFAEAQKADIDVINVIQRETVNHPERLRDLRNRFYTALDDLVPRQAREFCNPRTFVEVGNARHQIVEHIRERSIDLLVLGIKKTSHLGMQTRTSGAFQLIVEAACPVLTITG